MGQQPNIELEHTDLPRQRLAPGPARSWKPDRPADLNAPGSIPVGGPFGVIGPDAGYALKLAAELDLNLLPGEHHHDAVAGVAAIASARAAAFGRAPIADDVVVGAIVLGFGSEEPTQAALEKRPSWLANLGHDAAKLRAIVTDVPRDVLMATPDEVAARVSSGWVYRDEGVPE